MLIFIYYMQNTVTTYTFSKITIGTYIEISIKKIIQESAFRMGLFLRYVILQK